MHHVGHIVGTSSGRLIGGPSGQEFRVITKSCLSFFETSQLSSECPYFEL